MKQFLGVTLIIIMLMGVIYFTTGISYSKDPDPAQKSETEGGGGGAGTAIYNRYDDSCPLPNPTGREKTNCTANGSEQCTAKYCN